MHELQQRGLAALKAAQASQLASLRASRDIVVATRTPPPTVAPLMSTISEMTMSFTFAFLEQQIAYAKKITESLLIADHAVAATNGFEPATPVPGADRPVAVVAAAVHSPLEGKLTLRSSAIPQVAAHQYTTALETASIEFSDVRASVTLLEHSAAAPAAALPSESGAAVDEPLVTIQPTPPVPATTAHFGNLPDDEILSKTLPAPKAPVMNANAARKAVKAPSVSTKRSPKAGPGIK